MLFICILFVIINYIRIEGFKFLYIFKNNKLKGVIFVVFSFFVFMKVFLKIFLY